MKTIAFVNQKGGVAKTTSTLNVGAALAVYGKKVLLIDFDPQGSLSKCVGFRNLEGDLTVYEVIKGDANINEAIKTRHSVADYDILTTDLRLSGAEVELVGVPGRDTLLKEVLSDLEESYDYVLIDCSPSLNIFTMMALTACDDVIIPVAAQYMPLDGIAQLLPTVELIKKRLNKKLKIGGVLVTLVDSRRSLDKEIMEAIKNKFPKEIFNTVIKNNSKLAESPTYSKDIFEYDGKGYGASAYSAVAKEIIERG